MSPALIFMMMVGAAPVASPDGEAAEQAKAEATAEATTRNTVKLKPQVRRVSVTPRKLPAATDKPNAGNVAWSLQYRPLILKPNPDGSYRIIHGQAVKHRRPAPGAEPNSPEQPE
ncbi:MAG: hypothetical protein QNJ40_13370 [Xanthomonadales bacterium]|nr:hypothetical protein [Xanthomonadales bacterium]